MIGPPSLTFKRSGELQFLIEWKLFCGSLGTTSSPLINSFITEAFLFNPIVSYAITPLKTVLTYCLNEKWQNNSGMLLFRTILLPLFPTSTIWMRPISWSTSKPSMIRSTWIWSSRTNSCLFAFEICGPTGTIMYIITRTLSWIMLLTNDWIYGSHPALVYYGETWNTYLCKMGTLWWGHL